MTVYGDWSRVMSEETQSKCRASASITAFALGYLVFTIILPLLHRFRFAIWWKAKHTSFGCVAVLVRKKLLPRH
jgi:hypothetical protein